MISEPPSTPAIAGKSEVVAALVTRDERLAMTLGPARPWEASSGCALAPLALPSMLAAPGAGRAEALALAGHVLCLTLEPTPCPWTYGPSARHAMDRERAAASDAPFLGYERLEAPEEAPAEAEMAGGASQRLPHRVTVRVYLARARGESAGAAADVIWLPLGALGEARRGLWLADLLAMDGVTLTPAAGAPPTPSLASPENTLVYMPAGAGERQILRACAKYGDAILFPLSGAGGA
jgi:hypothetical protein